MSKPSDSWYGSQDLSGEERDAKGTKAVWLQDGVYHEEGERMAREAGLLVVVNDCLMRRHSQRG